MSDPHQPHGPDTKPAETTEGEAAAEEVPNPLKFNTLGKICMGWIYLSWGLTILYHIVGDAHAWSEYLTIYPPLLWWSFVLIPSGLVLLAFRPITPIVINIVNVLLIFPIVTMELKPLIRFSNGEARDLRMVSWNTGSHTDWPKVYQALAPLEPDVVLLQESPSGQLGQTTVTQPGYFQGWHLWNDGDCSLLSRWPGESLPSASVGPWSSPQIVALRPPKHEAILVTNVRLVLPSLVLFPFSQAARKSLVDGHRNRVDQFPKLANLITSTTKSQNYKAVVFGGDINTDGSARSILPLRKVGQDAWSEAGRGWGGTVTTRFPVARIDQLYSTGTLRAIEARVRAVEPSDHRALVVDFKWQ